MRCLAARHVTFLLVAVACSSIAGITFAERPVAFEPADGDPTRVDRALAGEVAVESFGDLAVVAIDTIDGTSRPDGAADHVARFTAAAAIEPALFYRGHAIVEFARRTLRVVPLDGSEALTFSVDAVPDAAHPPGRRFEKGSELIYLSDRDFGSVEQQVAELRRAARRDALRPIAAASVSEEHQDTGSGSGGGCASECSISCAGGGGSCSASCYQGKCAECTCDGEENLASCSCN